MENAENWIRRAEVLSVVGAFTLGLGLGAKFSVHLSGAALAIAAGGLALHAFGMLLKRRSERIAGIVPPRWAQVLYWCCWLLIVVALLVYSTSLEGVG